jgi:hypothetical protein
MESVQIQSMGALAEVVEAAADVVDDLGSFTLADIEKIIKSSALTKKDITEAIRESSTGQSSSVRDGVFTKKDITDAIREALTQSVLPVRDSSVLVRSQVKAEDVREARGGSGSSKNTTSGSDDLSWLSDSSKSSRKGGPSLQLSDKYHKLLNLLDTATHRPLKLLDMGVELLAKGADKALSVGAGLLGKGAGKLLGGLFKRGGGKKDDFFGSNDKEEGAGGDSRGESGFFVSGSQGREQSASVTSNGFGSVSGPLPGFVGDDFQTATAQGDFPFNFFNAAPDSFSSDRPEGVAGATSYDRGFARPATPLYPDMRPAESFGYTVLSNGVSGESSMGVGSNSLGVLANAGESLQGPSPVLAPLSPPPEFSSGSGPLLLPPPSSVSTPVFNSPLLPSPVSSSLPVPFVSEPGSASNSEAVNPFSGFFGLGELAGASTPGGATTADNLMVNSMESDMRANDILFRTFDEPERSDFGKFLDFQISGGTGAQGRSNDKGLLSELFGGLLFTGLLFTLPVIIRGVIDFLQSPSFQKLKDFVTGPLTKVATFAWNKAEEVITWATGPLWDEVLLPAMNWFKTEFLPNVVEPIIKVSTATVGGFLKSLGKFFNHEMSFMELMFGDESFGAILGREIAKALGVSEDSPITGILENAGRFGVPAAKLGSIVGPALFGMSPLVGALTFGVGATVVSSLFELMTANTNKAMGLDSLDLSTPEGQAAALERAQVLGAAMPGVPGMEASPVTGESVEKAIARVENLRRGWYELRHPTPEKQYLNLVSSGVSPLDARVFADEYASTYVPYEIYASTTAGGVSAEATSVGEVEDAIVTSDGQVIKTSPEDSIYAFKGDVSIAPVQSGGGGVSMAPANTMREFSGSPAGYNNQQSSVSSNVTNNYISQSNFNLSDLLPGSEFDPVGV